MAICKRLNVSGSNITIDSSYCGLGVQGPQPPSVVTDNPVPVDGATNGNPNTQFGGTVNPNGQATTAYFQWSINGSLPAPPSSGPGCTLATANFSAGSGSSATHYLKAGIYGGDNSTHVNFFNCNSNTYYYRMCASNAAGATCGQEVQFTLGGSSSSSSSSSGSSSGGSSSGGSSSGGCNTGVSVSIVTDEPTVVSVGGGCGSWYKASVTVHYCPSSGGQSQTASTTSGWMTSSTYAPGYIVQGQLFTILATGWVASDSNGNGATSGSTSKSVGTDTCDQPPPSSSSSSGQPSSGNGSSSSSSSSSGGGGGWCTLHPQDCF